MVIDVLNYTESQINSLSALQKAILEEGQMEKNVLYRSYQKKKEKAYFELVKNGTAISSLVSSINTKLDDEYSLALSDLQDVLIGRLENNLYKN